MKIILIGPPGAGKGTQANNLVKEFNLHKISTGDLLRDEIKNNTTLGNEIKLAILKKAAIIKSGEISEGQKNYSTTGAGTDRETKY